MNEVTLRNADAHTRARYTPHCERFILTFEAVALLSDVRMQSMYAREKEKERDFFFVESR